MLPPEVLKSVAEFLNRSELESLQLSSQAMKSMVERDFAVTPLRLLDQLMVLGLDNYVVSFNDEEVPCTSSSELSERFRLCRIDELSFDPTATLDQPLLDVLLPFKELWAMGRCCTPRRFQASEVFHEAFAQLLVCKKLFVHLPQRELFQLPSQFLSLPAVVGCHCLQLLTLHYPVEEEHVAEWLHAQDAASSSRFLQVSGQVALDASRLVSVLKEVRPQLTQGTSHASLNGTFNELLQAKTTKVFLGTKWHEVVLTAVDGSMKNT